MKTKERRVKQRQAKVNLTPQAWANVQDRYEAGQKVSDIAKEYGIGERSIYHRAKSENWKQHGALRVDHILKAKADVGEEISEGDVNTIERHNTKDKILKFPTDLKEITMPEETERDNTRDIEKRIKIILAEDEFKEKIRMIEEEEPEHIEEPIVDRKSLYMLVDNMAIRMKRHITAQYMFQEDQIYAHSKMMSKDALVKRLVSDIEKEDWIQLAIDASCIWNCDMSDFLGLYFTPDYGKRENYKLRCYIIDKNNFDTYSLGE
ncbi:MAG: hypothetical protein ABSB79_09385 [Syntrophales bacterium]|jgi:transposase-like protein